MDAVTGGVVVVRIVVLVAVFSSRTQKKRDSD